jgi:hypothetical protein
MAIAIVGWAYLQYLHGKRHPPAFTVTLQLVFQR